MRETSQRLEVMGDKDLTSPLPPTTEQVGILALTGEPGGTLQPWRICLLPEHFGAWKPLQVTLTKVKSCSLRHFDVSISTIRQ